MAMNPPDRPSRRPKLLLWPVLGAFIAVSGAFLYQWFAIERAGYALDAVPPLEMALDVMGLHRFALYGAVVGAVLGVLEWSIYAIRDRRSGDSETLDSDAAYDTDARIRAMRAKRAESYMASRARDAPPIENVITARDGAHVYRVMAYRELGEEELKRVVWEALEDGRIQQPTGTGTVTLVTDIGRE